ncbi:MAG: hypothetical protein WBL63_06105 [Candidatus Acidiferrum sp.]
MSEATNAPASGHGEDSRQASKPPEVFIHRVCTQCNNMFRVPADKFDAKQCPNCHKG